MATGGQDAGRGYDVIVVGSGVAGLTAACAAADRGARVILLEGADLLGGTSAVSGGMAWLPGSQAHGDSLEAARRYLDAAAPSPANPTRDAFLDHANEARTWLDARTSVKLVPVPSYPDYEPDLPESRLRGRCFEAVPFDGAELGAWFARLRPPLPEFMLMGGMMVSRADLPHFRKVFRSPRSTARVAGLLACHALQRLRHPRGTTLYLGNALVARLLKSALDLGVTIQTGAIVSALLRKDGGVAGVEIAQGRSAAKTVFGKAVILASGGFSHDAELRRRHLPEAAQKTTANIRTSGPAGARLAEPFGASIETSAGNRAFWVPGSPFTRHDGTEGVFPHTVTDRGKPGLIAVDGAGRRFVNEARSYHHFVMAMLEDAPARSPAYLICDADFLWNYGLGRVRPFRLSTRAERDSGYLVEAATIDELAKRLGLDPAALEETVANYNAAAERGEDPAFGRGGDAYQRHLGDGAHRPNPCVAPIRRAPYYAVAVQPADLGTAAGLRTDARGRVLDGAGAPVPGLYACGNDMNSVMNGFYPGPGITLGPALTFGYLAGRDAAAL
jgi:succinate dehydrogenase/fumarate reductase flavoprotein subunit